MVQGKFFGSFHLVAPLTTNKCGTFLSVQIFLNSAVRCSAKDGKHRQHLVILHELASLLDGLGWTIGVIVGDVVDLAAIDAALLIYHLEEAGLYLADAAKGGRWSAVGNDVAELDLGVGRADVVLLLGGCRLYDE